MNKPKPATTPEEAEKQKSPKATGSDRRRWWQQRNKKVAATPKETRPPIDPNVTLAKVQLFEGMLAHRQADDLAFEAEMKRLLAEAEREFDLNPDWIEGEFQVVEEDK